MKHSATALFESSNVVVSGACGPGVRTVVFLQGLGSEHQLWQLIIPVFEEHYGVILLDLPDRGVPNNDACCGPWPGPLDSYADDLLGTMRELALQNAVFVGHSAGALVGMLAAVREPQRFAQMVLISPAPRFLNGAGHAGGCQQSDLNELLAAVEGNCYGWSGQALGLTDQSERPELVLALTNSFVRTNPEIARHFARAAFLSDARAELAFLAIPTLILQSAHDGVAPLAVGHYINEQLANSRLVVVETQDHCPHLGAHQGTLAALHSFLLPAT